MSISSSAKVPVVSYDEARVRLEGRLEQLEEAARVFDVALRGIRGWRWRSRIEGLQPLLQRALQWVNEVTESLEIAKRRMGVEAHSLEFTRAVERCVRNRDSLLRRAQSLVSGSARRLDPEAALAELAARAPQLKAARAPLHGASWVSSGFVTLLVARDGGWWLVPASLVLVMFGVDWFRNSVWRDLRTDSVSIKGRRHPYSALHEIRLRPCNGRGNVFVDDSKRTHLTVELVGGFFETFAVATPQKARELANGLAILLEKPMREVP